MQARDVSLCDSRQGCRRKVKKFKANQYSHLSEREWASPIVLGLKKYGSICVDTDSKLTLNGVPVLETYAVPRVEDLWVKLSGGQRLRALNLKGAYQRLDMNEESRKLCASHMP